MIITSTSNQLIKDLKKQKTKNRFLLFLDTPILVNEAISCGLTPKYIFVEKDKKFDFVKSFEIIEVSSQVLKALSFVEENAGIVGIFNLEKKIFENPIENFLVLDTLQDAGNIGTLLRTAVGTGFNQVYLLDCASISNEKVIRSSAGAIFKLNIYEITRDEFIQNFKNKNLFYADMNGTNIFNKTIKPPNPLGIVIGNEGKGVSQEIKNLCMGSFSLPMKNGLESLNAAVSGSVIMYQISFGG